VGFDPVKKERNSGSCSLVMESESRMNYMILVSASFERARHIAAD